MREFFDLANNPLFVKHLRSRLRRSSLLPGAVIVIFVSLSIVWINSQAKGPNNPDPNIGSQMFFWLQGFLLVLMGGSQVASSIAQMKESGVIDFLRITPLPSRIKTIGIMIGAPIRELILYAMTLPFAFYLALQGPVGAGNFAKLVLVQLGSALMYYSLGLVTGLSGTKARGASGRFVAILFILNLLASFFFTAGIYGPTLVTAMPIYQEVFREDDDAPRQQRRGAQPQPMQRQQAQQPMGGGPNQGPANQQNQQVPVQPEKREVTFYGVSLPIVVQSLMFQGCLLTFLFIGAARRIHSARIPLYTKPIALLFISSISFLTLGSLWDAPTLFLTLGAVYFLTFAAIFLSNAVTPPLGDIVKGMQRAHKLHGSKVPIWTDLATNKFIVFSFACVVAATVSIGLLLAPQPPALGFIQLRHVFSPWPCLLVGCLMILTHGFASQYLAMAYGNRSRPLYGLFIFIAWVAPIIVGMIVILADIDGGGYILAISPIVGIASAGMFGVPNLNEMAIKIASITPGAICVLAFFVLYLAQERKLMGEVVDEHAARRRRKQDRMDDYNDEPMG